ncbi:DUF5666 domain-containing protein [Edaphobacter dinghuensis]|uniref:DUF5666 domain-containing protein n=1 Tax=Edaphobacter dinghuensis TaxID=1560005 RepID=A0A917MCS3_9BACT|nr:DUF5666 domain-containing protein [Edaphobacter dinghuensis]GGG88936.1 hypothetical protein GCM10011585_36320 [Edaphobacter dinghuensis]
MVIRLGIFRASIFGASLLLPAVGFIPCCTVAQAQVAAGPKIGTVTTISGSTLTLMTDSKQQITVTVADGARVLQLAPGSKDLKSAQTITLGDVSKGDRILVSGQPGSDGISFTASRVILMKAQDIAQVHAKEQADWQSRGTGGLVSAVDDGSGTITVSIGAKKVAVQTSSATTFRRYSGGSVKFEDAQPSNLSEIHAGDQVRVLGAKSDDGSSIKAEIIVSGSFLHLAGMIATMNAANGTFTIKDLATKKTMTVKVTADSDVRKLPPQAAARIAARAKGAAPSAGHPGAGNARPAQASAPAPEGGEEQRRSAGMDLSQMLSRLPTQTLADLKVGDAVMIVASQPDTGSPNVSAVTLLSGVEPILSATPNGAATMSLSPWQVGGGEPDAGGGSSQ